MTRSLAFFDGDITKGWQRALAYAGDGGRVATMLDVADARIATLKSHKRWDRRGVWSSYVTTSSAEYVGVSKGGNRILIVAHGVGPLAQPTDYKRVYKKRGDDDRCPRGAISRKDFHALEAGKFGDVTIIDYDAIFDRYEYPFLEAVGADVLRNDPWFKARVGPRWEEFLDALVKADLEYAESSEAQGRVWETTSKKFPPIVGMEGPRNEASYGFREWAGRPRQTFEKVNQWLDEGMALANLLTLGQPTKTHFPEYRPRAVVSTQLDLHSHGDGTRFVAMPPGTTADFTTVDSNQILSKHWRDLIIPAEGKPSRLRHIMEFGDGWFAQTLKTGESMDTGVPEHPIKSMRKIGPGVFRTEIIGYYGFLRYGLHEVEAIAPPEANAYVVGDAQIVDNAKFHEVPVTFYHADIDYQHRLMTTDEIEADVNLLTKLVD